MTFTRANTTYEVDHNGNKYQIVLPANAPLGEAYDVIFKFLAIIADQIKVNSETLKQKEEVKGENES